MRVVICVDALLGISVFDVVAPVFGGLANSEQTALRAERGGP